MIRQSIDPIRDQILDAYEEEYAPDCEECGAKASLIRDKVNLSNILDMASCLLYDWSGDPDYEDCERDFS